MQTTHKSIEYIINDKSLDLRQCTSLSILTAKNVQIDKQFLIKYTKENVKTIDREAKKNCKVIQFFSNWNFEDILAAVGALNRDEYPNLFTFIIEIKNVGFGTDKSITQTWLSYFSGIKRNENVKNLKNALLKFSQSRPLILQLTSNEERLTKFYYKLENSKHFRKVEELQKNFKKFKNFSTFLMMLLSGDIERIEELIINQFKDVKNRLLILRFLKTLKLSEEFFNRLLLKCAESGTKNDLLAALDAPFDIDGRVLSVEAQIYLSDVIYEDQLTNKSPDDLEQAEETEASSENVESSSDQEDSSSLTSSVYSNNHMNPSVLYTAIKYKNKEIIDYLIFHWTHLIQQLPLKHQIRISTAAFETKQFDVLCILLKIADFPFPEDFDLDLTVNEKLSRIAKDRKKFATAIKSSSFEEMDKFIDNNHNLRIVYNTSNKSALKQAVNLKKYEVYVYLSSLGFNATEFESLEEVLNDEELKKANEHIVKQRRHNVNESIPVEEKTVYLLLLKSSIHNRKISKSKEAEYRAKIKKWYDDIKKIKSGSELLNAAASCESLKIIFDFESDTVENVSLAGKNSLGSMYPKSKWIFVGAKLYDEEREQQIKGVLAHELCHYVMKLVYENQEKPYYKHEADLEKLYEEIVGAINKWSKKASEFPDDECDGTISSVFTNYNPEDFHPELIVRVVQILVEYYGNARKLETLGKKYKGLFDYWHDNVYPELVKFNLNHRENVRKLNSAFEILEEIKSENFDFPASEATEKLLDNKFTIVTTNISMLLLINIYNFLKEKFGDLLDAQNIFVDPEKLKKETLLSDFEKILTENSNLNIFVDCTRSKFPEYLGNVFTNKDLKLIFIVSNEDCTSDLVSNMKNHETSPVEVNISYKCILIQNQSSGYNSSTGSRLLSKINLNINSRTLLMNEAIPEIPFRNVTISDIGIESDSTKLQEIIKKFENSIEFLNIEYVRVIDIKQLQEIFSGLSNLKVINLHACCIKELKDETLPIIPSLKFVIFNECDGNFFAIFKNQNSIEKVEVCSYEWDTSTFSFSDFEGMSATLQNLNSITFDGVGTGLYFEHGKFPYKVRKLEAYMLNFLWFQDTLRLDFLKLQQGHLKELMIQKLPYDFDGREVLKFIIEEMGLEKFYYRSIPLILDGKKQKVEKFLATDVQILSTFEMFRQFPSIQSFSLFLTETGIHKQKVEQVLQPQTDLFENLRDLDVLDHSGSKNLLAIYIGLYKNCRNITRLSFRTDDVEINSILRLCLPEMKKLREIYLPTRDTNIWERLETIRKYAPNISKLTVAEQFVPITKRFFKNEVEIVSLTVNIQPECFSFD